MKTGHPLSLFALALSLCALTGADGGGCGTGLDNRPGVPGVDVGGVSGAKWQVSYGDTVQVIVKGGAGVVSTTDLSMGSGGTFSVGGVSIDFHGLCARGDLACPQDVFPATVTMTQPGNNRHLLYVTFNPKGPLGAIQQQTLLGNVDSDQNFAIALGVGGAAAGNCGLLGVSYANGSITTAPLTDPPLGQRMDGTMITSYTGACVAAGSGAAAGAGLTVEFHLPFTAQRM